MDFSATIDLIIKDLNEASEIIDDLKKYPGVPALQVELAKSKCRSAGDVIALLKSMNDIIPASGTAVIEKQQSKPQASAPEKALQPEVKQPVDESINENVASLIEISAPGKKSEKKPPAKKAVNEPIVADKFSHTSDLYEEQSANIKAEMDLSDQLKKKQIKSLTEVIGISDKFLFMGEIFNGDKEAYAQAISRLDQAESFEDAMTVIISYTGGNTDSEAVTQLVELVKLKLPSNE
jgi:hypothetical protein